MIWFNEKLSVPEQPAGAVVELAGKFELNNDSTPPIRILLVFQDCSEDTITERVLYSHTPSGMLTEEPQKEDVLNRYRGKITKLINRITKTPYHELQNLQPIS